MLRLYSWPTPNGQKIHIALEELELPYELVPVNIGAGEQFKPEFLAITPNHRIPAIVDPEGPGGELPLFESGAILMYLAEKTGKLLPKDPRARYLALQWLMFQMGGVGPMFGQQGHFVFYAKEKIPYALDRYTNEVRRLYGVLETRLSQSTYLAGDEYSIADIATFPWARGGDRRGFDVPKDFPNVQRWIEAIDARPAVKRGLAVLEDRTRTKPVTDAERDVLFGSKQFATR
ncbi:Glutathione S-transferase [Labilithrix luteola]|uniref:Glutathione S-transferase n=1 Tax=Labilithrix luteola TaxID=1391654 RepID=A0A0K1PZR0_9BACT|nr:glutathione binding-like protein [Labilithrix luteola]AKU98639.1 Glutathione S-transferase [Labilithrix luteola]